MLDVLVELLLEVIHDALQHLPQVGHLQQEQRSWLFIVAFAEGGVVQAGLYRNCRHLQFLTTNSLPLTYCGIFISRSSQGTMEFEIYTEGLFSLSKLSEA